MRVIFLILIGFSSLSFAEFSKQNGVVYDSITKLEWQDDYSDNYGDVRVATWQYAIDYCEALSLDGGGWRLPNIRALESLVDDTKCNPSINAIFEFTSSGHYWSSTSAFSADSNKHSAWIVHFDIGNVSIRVKDNFFGNDVRCVRAGE